jgi:hypothetical protein
MKTNRLTIGGHSDLETVQIPSQLRDSVGLAPNFPRFLQRLLPVGTDVLKYYISQASTSQSKLASKKTKYSTHVPIIPYM